MNIQELRALPRDKLVEIAARKNRKGNGTREALSAQKVLRERSGHWPGVPRKACTFEGMRIKEKGGNGLSRSSNKSAASRRQPGKRQAKKTPTSL